MPHTYKWMVATDKLAATPAMPAQRGSNSKSSIPVKRKRIVNTSVSSSAVLNTSYLLLTDDWCGYNNKLLNRCLTDIHAMLNQKEILKNRKTLSETDKTIAAVFKVLSDVNRYRIFSILAKQPKLTISDISRILDISMPLASQHIKVLVQAHLLKKERDGKKVFPKLEHDNPFVQAIIKTIQRAL